MNTRRTTMAQTLLFTFILSFSFGSATFIALLVSGVIQHLDTPVTIATVVMGTLNGALISVVIAVRSSVKDRPKPEQHP